MTRWNAFFLAIIFLPLMWFMISPPHFGTEVNKDVSLPKIVANYSGGLYSEILIS